MPKTYKNIPSLHRFLESAPIEAIQAFLTEVEASAYAPHFATIDWPIDGVGTPAAHGLRQALLKHCASLGGEVGMPLDGHARRIVNLSEGKGIEAIQVVRENLFQFDTPEHSVTGKYESQKDHFGRATVVYLRAAALFDEAEKYFFAEHHRNYGKLYEAFDLDCDDVDRFDWTDEKQARTEALLQERLGTAGRCLVQHLPFEQQDAVRDPHTVHLFLIRHAGEMNSVENLHEDLSKGPLYYRPPVEATVLFLPERKSVEVFTEKESNRFLIASAFAETAIDAGLSGRPVTLRQYNLRRFYRSLSLSQAPISDLGLIDVRVVEAEARLQDFKRRVSLKVYKNDDIEEAAKETLGDSNIFKSAALISRIVVNVRFMKDGKEVNLPIILSTPNRCNLGSRRDPKERELGFAVHIVHSVVPLGAGEEASLIESMLRLYESDAREVRRSLLEAWGADIEIRTGGFLKPMGRAMDVVRIADDGTPVRLAVRPKGAVLVADDPVTHASIEIDPVELERFEVMRGWVAERVIKGLKEALQIGQRSKEDALVTKLGTLFVGDEDVPVFLAKCLSRAEMVSAVDAYLRGERQIGYGLVLTASEIRPDYLGANVVVWLGDVLSAGERGDPDRQGAARADAEGRQAAGPRRDVGRAGQPRRAPGAGARDLVRPWQRSVAPCGPTGHPGRAARESLQGARSHPSEQGAVRGHELQPSQAGLP